MLEDLRTVWRRDPALFGARMAEVLLYQGLWALWAYRLAHLLYRWRVPFVPRAISQFLRALTGIEIHPGAPIGRRPCRRTRSGAVGHTGPGPRRRRPVGRDPCLH